MAELPHAGYVAVSVASAVMWGLLPVLSRYIQTRAAGHPSSVALLGCICLANAVACAALMGGQALRNPSAAPAAASTRRRLRTAAAYGLICTARMWTNLQSTRMTTAWNVQMTAMLLPFVTAVLARFILRERPHAALPPTLVLTLLGSLAVLAGQGAFGAAADSALSARDLAGIGVQLASVCLSAAIKVALKFTEGTLGKLELMQSQFCVTGTITLAYALAADRSSLAALAALDGAGWACFFGLSFGIYGLANFMQIVATRRLGAINHSASNPVRLLAAVGGSAAVLGEPMSDPLEWLGAAVIVVSLSLYYAAQRRWPSRPAARADAGGGAAEPPAARGRRWRELEEVR